MSPKNIDWILCLGVPFASQLKVPEGCLAQINIKHGRESDKPLPYAHLDIAGSAGDLPENPTGAPILALAKQFLMRDLEKQWANDADSKSPEK